MKFPIESPPRECERAGVVVHNWRHETGCLNVTSFTFGRGGSGRGEAGDLTGNEVAVVNDAAVAPWVGTREHKSKWPGQILSAATLNDQQKIEPVESGLGRVEAGESLSFELTVACFQLKESLGFMTSGQFVQSFWPVVAFKSVCFS